MEFIPQVDQPYHWDKDGHNTCAKVLAQQGRLYPEYDFKDTTPGERDEKAPYSQYMMFARDVAQTIWEAENIDGCTYEAIHDRVNKTRLLEELPQKGDLDFAIDRLIEEMTLLRHPYNFLSQRMFSHPRNGDHVYRSPRVLFQQLGLFEEDDSDATQGKTQRFQGVIPTVDCLCDVLGVQIDWTMSLADHLNFDEPKRRLTLFRLPSFCGINQQSHSSVFHKQVLLSCH